MTTQMYETLRRDPRGVLKALRQGDAVGMVCHRCNNIVQADPATTEISRRLDGDKMVFYRRCPQCGHKLYWQEIHLFIQRHH